MLLILIIIEYVKHLVIFLDNGRNHLHIGLSYVLHGLNDLFTIRALFNVIICKPRKCILRIFHITINS